MNERLCIVASDLGDAGKLLIIDKSVDFLSHQPACLPALDCNIRSYFISYTPLAFGRRTRESCGPLHARQGLGLLYCHEPLPYLTYLMPADHFVHRTILFPLNITSTLLKMVQRIPDDRLQDEFRAWNLHKTGVSIDGLTPPHPWLFGFRPFYLQQQAIREALRKNQLPSDWPWSTSLIVFSKQILLLVY